MWGRCLINLGIAKYWNALQPFGHSAQVKLFYTDLWNEDHVLQHKDIQYLLNIIHLVDHMWNNEENEVWK